VKAPQHIFIAYVMELEAEHKFPVRKVPCASGSRLHFSWGTGHCLNLVDCCARSNLATHTGIQSAQHVATTLRWYFPSETMRRVSCDVQPHHEGLQQKRYSGAIVEGSAEWAEEVERYSRTISSVMGRDNDVRYARVGAAERSSSPLLISNDISS